MSRDVEMRQYIRGALFGLAAVGIWSGWVLASRLGLRTTSLTLWDITAIVLPLRDQSCCHTCSRTGWQSIVSVGLD
jgi:hypothetical protein